MSQIIEYTHWVEIALIVRCKLQKEEKRSKYSDGCNAAMGVDDIEILTEEDGPPVADLKALKDYLLDKYNDEFASNAWDYR